MAISNHTPCSGLLATGAGPGYFQGYSEWIPWKKILSEKAATEVRQRRPRNAQSDILEFLSESAGLCELEWDQSLSPSPYRLLRMLQVRGYAYSMVGACHLGTWNIYIDKFLEFYAAEVSEHFRAPSLGEAEAADKVAMTEIFNLCFGGATLDDVVSSVVLDCDILRHLLMPRPKVAKADKPPACGFGGEETEDETTCHKAMEGVCNDPNCRWSHVCNVCVAHPSIFPWIAPRSVRVVSD